MEKVEPKKVFNWFGYAKLGKYIDLCAPALRPIFHSFSVLNRLKALLPYQKTIIIF